MLEQYVLEYGGFSRLRGRCHLVVDRALAKAMAGSPRDNPGTSVTNAIEEVALEIRRSIDLDVLDGQLYEYFAWEPVFRRERVQKVVFRGDAWSLPVWEDPDAGDPFVAAALAAVHEIQPYALTSMGDLTVLNPVVRVRIEVPKDPDTRELIDRIGTVQHISQQRFFYVDVAADSDEAAVALARDVLAGRVDPDQVRVTTPNAPLDQPGSIPG